MDAPLELNSSKRFVNWDDQNDEFLPWSADDSWVEIPEGKMPIGMEITEFHYLMIYLDRFIAVNRLSQKAAQVISANSTYNKVPHDKISKI